MGENKYEYEVCRYMEKINTNKEGIELGINTKISRSDLFNG
jgi:hypothetical protein